MLKNFNLSLKYNINQYDNIYILVSNLGYGVFPEVREEYMYRYVDGAIGRCTWAQAYEKRGKFRDLGVDLPRQQPQSSTSLRLPVDVTPEEATQLGFMAHRGDFERVRICFRARKFK